MKYFHIPFLKARTHTPNRVVVARELVSPEHDWFVGLAVAALVFLLGVAYIAYDFYVQFEMPQEAPLVEQDLITYPERDVRRYAEEYRQQEEAFEVLRARAPRPPVTAPAEPLAEAE